MEGGGVVDVTDVGIGIGRGGEFDGGVQVVQVVSVIDVVECDGCGGEGVEIGGVGVLEGARGVEGVDEDGGATGDAVA